MTMHDVELVDEVRKAFVDITDQAPLPPEWHDLRLDTARPIPTSILTLRRGLAVAAGVAVAVVGVVGTVALFGGPGDEVQVEPTTLSPTVTVAADNVTTTLPPATTSIPDAAVTTPSPVDWQDLRSHIGSVSASSNLNSAHAVGNLIDGSQATVWNDASLRGQAAEMFFLFEEPVYIDSIVIVNHPDETQRRRNYQVKTFEVEYQSGGGSVVVGAIIPESADRYTLDVDSYHEGLIVIRVKEVWPAEAVDGDAPFEELAIAEIEFFGTIPPHDEARRAAVEARLNEMLVAETRVSNSIARLRESLEGASAEAAEELRDLLVLAEASRARMQGEIVTIRQLLEADS